MKIMCDDRLANKAEKAMALPCWLWGILLLATLGRIMLAMKLPLYMQDAPVDDYLLARYAGSLLAGEWLGEFDQFTLVKTISYPLFLAGTFMLGVPYQLALILFYILAVALLSRSLARLFASPRWGALLYLFLLYSPVMLHQENVQKLYRGGCLVSASLLVIALFVEIYAARGDLSRLWRWSLAAALALPFFYYLKEDGFWLLPFCGGAALMTVLHRAGEGGGRGLGPVAFWAVLPFLALGFCHFLYSGLNYQYYGVWAVTDRSGTHLREVAHDLLMIAPEGGPEKPEVWVSHAAFRQAMAVSPTLAQFEEPVERFYSGELFIQPDGELWGDFYLWGLRQILSDEGWYEGNASPVEELYGKIHAELTEAFRDGRLREREAFYLSAVTQGIGPGDWQYFTSTFREHFKMMAYYRGSELTLATAWGNRDHLQEMCALANAPALWPERKMDIELAICRDAVLLAGDINSTYARWARPMLRWGELGLLLLAVRTAFCLRRGRKAPWPNLLLLLGLSASGGALFLGVQWFSRFLGLRKFYDYVACAIPILQILEMAGLYYLCLGLKDLAVWLWQRWKVRGEC